MSIFICSEIKNKEYGISTYSRGQDIESTTVLNIAPNTHK